MAVHAEYGLAGIGRMFNDVADKSGIFTGNGISYSIRQVDGGRSCLDYFRHHAHQKVRMGTGGILSGKFDIRRISGGTFHARYRHFHHLIRAFAQLVFHVDGRCGEEGVNTRLRCMANGFPCAIDISRRTTGQSGDFSIFHQSRDGLHGLEIPLAGSGKARFQTVHTQYFQLMRKTEFFLKIHGRAGALFPVAQCGVENADAIAHGCDLKMVCQCKKNRNGPSGGTVPTLVTYVMPVVLSYSVASGDAVSACCGGAAAERYKSGRTGYSRDRPETPTDGAWKRAVRRSAARTQEC